MMTGERITMDKQSNEVSDRKGNPSHRPLVGYVEHITCKMRGYGYYKYRVIGRHGYPLHHTNDRDDADSYLESCRNNWFKKET